MFNYACIFGDRPGNVKIADFWMSFDDPPIQEYNSTADTSQPVVVLIWKVGLTPTIHMEEKVLDKAVHVYNITNIFKNGLSFISKRL